MARSSGRRPCLPIRSIPVRGLRQKNRHGGLLLLRASLIMSVIASDTSLIRSQHGLPLLTEPFDAEFDDIAGF
jgi:hypothetical protein